MGKICRDAQKGPLKMMEQYFQMTKMTRLETCAKQGWSAKIPKITMKKMKIARTINQDVLGMPLGMMEISQKIQKMMLRVKHALQPIVWILKVLRQTQTRDALTQILNVQ